MRNYFTLSLLVLSAIPTLAQPFTCDRTQDSLALVDFYETLEGLEWDLTQPIDSFEGVVLNEAGCVERIHVYSESLYGSIPDVNLPHLKSLGIGGEYLGDFDCPVVENAAISGPIPDFCCLPRLEQLTLRFFNAIASVPNFSQLPELETLEIIAPDLSGELPDLAACTQLRNIRIGGYAFLANAVCVIDSTQLGGPVPNFPLPALQSLDLRYNLLTDTVPDLASLPEEAVVDLRYNQLNAIDTLATLARLDVSHNYFTFEDLLPQLDRFIAYAPQKEMPVDPVVFISSGGNPVIELPFDHGVTGSTYVWLRDGAPIDTTTGNQLEILDPSSVNGSYRVLVTNLQAPVLELRTQDFYVDLCDELYGEPEVITAEICEGQTYHFNGQILDTAGEYSADLTSVEGCDSIVTLTLTVTPFLTETITAEICEGDTYQFRGIILSQSGTYTAELTSAEGCDSLVTLVLVVLPSPAETITAEICKGKAYNFNGQLLTESGTYVEDQTTADGCDSLAILHLVVTPPPIDTIAAEICEPVYYFPGAPRETGTYFAVVTDAEGCEMVIRLDLVVHPIQVEHIKVTIDEGDAYLLPDGSTEATTSGTYSFTLTSAQGCDSIVVVDVRVLPHLVPAPEPGEISEEDDLGKNKRKRFPDWVSPVPLPLRSGPATNQVPMNRALSGPSEEVSFDVYPNPCGDQLTLDTHGLDLPNTATVRLFDLSGREVPLAVTWRSGTVPVDVSHVPPGVYLIKLIGEDRPLAVAKMVKY